MERNLGTDSVPERPPFLTVQSTQSDVGFSDLPDDIEKLSDGELARIVPPLIQKLNKKVSRRQAKLAEADSELKKCFNYLVACSVEYDGAQYLPAEDPTKSVRCATACRKWREATEAYNRAEKERDDCKERLGSNKQSISQILSSLKEVQITRIGDTDEYKIVAKKRKNDPSSSSFVLGAVEQENTAELSVNSTPNRRPPFASLPSASTPTSPRQEASLTPSKRKADNLIITCCICDNPSSEFDGVACCESCRSHYHQTCHESHYHVPIPRLAICTSRSWVCSGCMTFDA